MMAKNDRLTGYLKRRFTDSGIEALANLADYAGKSEAEKWGSLKTEVKNVKEKLDDPISGLGAIKKCVDEQRTRCASVTGTFNERIRSLEEESGRGKHG